jgi:hypothetical protein
MTKTYKQLVQETIEQLTVDKKLTVDLTAEQFLNNKENFFRLILNFGHLSEEFLRETIKQCNICDSGTWSVISSEQKLSEDFIREFEDKVDWRFISLDQKLSYSFIREFQDKVDWKYILMRQNFCEDFLIEFYDKIDFDLLKYNKHLKKLIPKKNLHKLKSRINIKRQKLLYNICNIILD